MNRYYYFKNEPDFEKLARATRRILNQIFEYDESIPNECFSMDDIDALQEIEMMLWVMDYNIKAGVIQPYEI